MNRFPARRLAERADLSVPRGVPRMGARYDADAFGRFSEAIARFLGTGRFLAGQTVFVIGWIALNTIGLLRHWDPYPFILLNLAFSTQAAYAAPLILLAQNRQDDRDRAIIERDREVAARTQADTEFLAREIASIRLALADVVTRADLDDSLDRLAKLLADRPLPGAAPPAEPLPGGRRGGTLRSMTAATSDTVRTTWGAYIGGSFTGPGDGEETFEVTEPATGRPLARVVSGGAALADRAVARARQAFPAWRDTPPRERGRLLRLVAATIRAHADELAGLEAREVGKPRRDALRFDVSYCSAGFDYYAGLGETLHGEIIDQGPIEARVIYEPYGVVAAILPFNWPPIHFTKKCAPALAAGNTVVIKPGEQAPLTVLRLAELAGQVLPPGVLNAVPGLAAGPALAGHPRVERITFTGATATGRRVLASAAENLTYATMELGGKNAVLVLADADLDAAVDVAIEGMFYNQGEACTSTARILVHDDVHDEFLARFARATQALVTGDGLDPATDIGPMVDAAQRDKVLGYLRAGLAQGARLVTQGRLPDDERLRDGYWVAPTVLADVTPAMTIAQEEIFGPVACVMRFATEDEAIEIANGTAYGLTAAICTTDLVRADRIARRLEAGMVFVNNYMRRAFLGSPFGGVKGSGFGRENAIETLHEFVRSKNIRFPSGRGPVPVWPPRDAILTT